VKGEGEHIRLADDNLWDDTQELEGWCASMGSQPVAQNHAGSLQHSQSLVEMSWGFLR